MTMQETIDPSLCPLCGQKNACENVKCGASDNSCWCNSPNIRFEAALLGKIPDSHKNQACICQQCAGSFTEVK